LLAGVNHVSNRLAARSGIRQVEAVVKADAAADAAEAAVRRVWADVLRLLKQLKHPFHSRASFHQAALEVFSRLHGVVEGTLAYHFRRLATWGHHETAATLAATLPLGYLAAAARKLEEGYKRPEELCLESEGDDYLEAVADPGAIGLSLDRNQHLRAADRARPLRDLFQSLLFPPPPQDVIDRIVFAPSAGVSWRDRLAAATKLAGPFQLAQVLADGYAQGKTQQQLAKDLMPVVQGVATSARRIARTEGLRIAHAVQLEAFAECEGLIIGFQIHATLDQNTRSWHAQRSGTIYYLHPTGDQKGPRQQPHPPLEAEDPSERPAGTPQTAYC
jgi:F like protein